MADGKKEGDVQKQDPADLPGRDQLVKVVAVQQKIAKAQAYAKSLREKAATVTDSKERERLIKEAYDKEVEAHGDHSKLARRLQSGSWQGAAAGGGIGLGTGLGLGTVVGALVGGLVSIPTTALGGLIGTGVGAIHGPFIKLGGKNMDWANTSPEKVVDAIQQEYASKKDTMMPAQEVPAEAGAEVPSPPSEQPEKKPRKKPRKLEIRSQQNQAATEKTETSS